MKLVVVGQRPFAFGHFGALGLEEPLPEPLRFGLLAIGFWRERLELSRTWRRLAGAAVAIGLIMSALALDSDILRTMGISISRRDPADGWRGWKRNDGA